MDTREYSSSKDRGQLVCKQIYDSTDRPTSHQDSLDFLNEKGSPISNYQSFRPSESTGLETRNVLDVIVMGKVRAKAYSCPFVENDTLQTDDRYTAAWGAVYVLGRVRLTDGLVILSRECVCSIQTSSLPFLNIYKVSGSDTTLMRGYGKAHALSKDAVNDVIHLVTSSQNFAGRLKPVSSGVSPADWEAVFSLSKEHSSLALNLSD